MNRANEIISMQLWGFLWGLRESSHQLQLGYAEPQQPQEPPSWPPSHCSRTSNDQFRPWEPGLQRGRYDHTTIFSIHLHAFKYGNDLPWSAAEHYALATCGTLLPDVPIEPLWHPTQLLWHVSVLGKARARLWLSWALPQVRETSWHNSRSRHVAWHCSLWEYWVGWSSPQVQHAGRQKRHYQQPFRVPGGQ